ncbi:kinase-like protein, partial [Didymella exigua CBS 183.55]
MVLEHCPIGDLHEFYKKQEDLEDKAAFSERFMWTIFKQLAEALAFVRKGVLLKGKKRSPVVHCDIKPHNILIKSLEKNRDLSSISIKLADFGLAIHYDSKVNYQSFFGSPAYCPPEINWDDPMYTPALDVWAMGAVMH